MVLFQNGIQNDTLAALALFSIKDGLEACYVTQMKSSCK